MSNFWWSNSGKVEESINRVRIESVKQNPEMEWVPLAKGV